MRVQKEEQNRVEWDDVWKEEKWSKLTTLLFREMPLVFHLKACKLPSQKIFNPYLMQWNR